MSLSVGDAFPPGPVQTADGPVDLSQQWAEGPLVVAFHRLWCPFCQQAVKEMEPHQDELRAVIVYRQDADTVAGKCSDRHVPFDCASDPDQQLERAARVGRFKASRYARFSPRKLVGALKAGGRVGMLNTDILQGRGTYVVGRDGRIAYVHISQNASDIPPVDDLLAAVRAAA